jgi:arginase family enzyme
MPLRMILDSGAVEPCDVVLVGARNLDPPETEFVAASGIHTGEDAVNSALGGADGVYVALDVDVFDPEDVGSFMPEPGGLRVDAVEAVFTRIASEATVLGAGISGSAPEQRNVEPLTRLCRALGL